MKRVMCDCNCGDPCPQGRVGTTSRCVIWVKDQWGLPSIDAMPAIEPREKKNVDEQALAQLFSSFQNQLPEKTTRLERIVCAMLRNGIHSHPAKGEFAESLVSNARLIEKWLLNIEHGKFLPNKHYPGIPGYTCEGFIRECARQLVIVNVHQNDSWAVAEHLANVFYLKPP